MLVRRAFVPQGLQPDSFAAWPFSVPCVAELATHGLTLTEPVTMLVGENGSGKSRLVEAIAEGFKLDPHGGRANRKYGNQRPKTPLGQVLNLETTASGRGCCPGPAPGGKGSSCAPKPPSG